jgi:hypothetical protein
VIGVEACQSRQFIAILGIFDSTQFQDSTVRLDQIGKFLAIFLGNTSEKLNESLNEGLLELLEENRRLQGLAGDVQR